MKRLIPVLALAFALPFFAEAQQKDTIQLQDCYRQVEQHFPLAEQRSLSKKASDLSIQKLNTQYLPQLSLNAQATYQSDVISLPGDIPFLKLPSPSKDQYKATIDLNQLIYDGNAIRYQRNIMAVNEQLNEQKITLQLQDLKQQVAEVYYSILLANAQMKVLGLMEENLQAQIKKTNSAVANGILLPMNAEQLKVQLIQLRQQKYTLQQNKLASIDALAQLTGLSLDSNAFFALPKNPETIGDDFSQRAEYKLFSSQKMSLQAQDKSINARTLPKLFAFGQAGYGRPGLNPLDNNFQDFYIAGLKLSWTPFQWNANEFERQMLKVNEDIVSSQQKVFDINTRAAMAHQKANIISLQQQLKDDEEIIGLRHNITKASASQMENGTGTATDYLLQFNAEQQALLEKEKHLIEFEKAKTEYLFTTGNQ